MPTAGDCKDVCDGDPAKAASGAILRRCKYSIIPSTLRMLSGVEQGWSAGGVIAYEGARQLVESGFEVKSLILIDSPCPLIIEPLPISLHRWFASIGLLGDGEFDVSKLPTWLLPHFQASINALSGYTATATPVDPARAPETYAIWCQDGICKEPTDPRPEPYPYGHAQWLLESKTDFGTDMWENFLPKDKIHCSSVGGNHFTMMKGNNVSRRGAHAAQTKADDCLQVQQLGREIKKAMDA